MTIETPAPRASTALLFQLMEKVQQRLDRWAVYIVAMLAVDAFLLLESSLDVAVFGAERLKALKREGRNPLLVIWHGQGLLPLTTFRGEHLCLYASHTRDPKYSPLLKRIRWWTLRFVERMGYRVLDASEFKTESRGVLAFVDLLRSGTGSVIAADGPQGPIYRAKPGPTFLAKKTGVTLLPIGVAISGGFQLDNWDRFEIPWPFSRAVIVVGEPVEVPPGANDAIQEAVRLSLETEMNRRVLEARRRLGLPALEATEEKEGERGEREHQPAEEQRIEQEQPGRQRKTRQQKQAESASTANEQQADG